MVQITTDNVELIPYRKFDEYAVWKSHIIKKEFRYIPPTLDNCVFYKFISNVSDREANTIAAFISVIGYLLHNYNSEAKGQCVILYDRALSEKDNANGGTGKSLIRQAIGKVRETIVIDGRFFDENDKFRYQNINRTSQVVALEDLKPQVSFNIFYSCLTDGMTIEKKHEKQIRLQVEKTPKMLFTFNTIIGGTGSSDKRRQFILELSDYYSSKLTNDGISPVEKEHGVLFSNDWDSEQWNVFYSFIVICLKDYLTNGLQPYTPKNINKNRVIQNCGRDFANWAYDKEFETDTKYPTKELFHDYKNIYYGDNSEFAQRTFTNYLKKYAEAENLDFNPKIKSNNVSFFMLTSLKKS